MVKCGLTARVVVVLAIGVSTQTGAQAPEPATQTSTPTAGSPRSAAMTRTGWTKKTPWGDPDLQGIWNNGTTTPLQRPVALGDKATLTPEEFATKQKEDARRQAVGETAEQRARSTITGGGPTFWYEIGETSPRTSLIIDPPNGRLPAFTPYAQQRLEERARMLAEIPLTSFLWKHQGQWVRCITRGVPGGQIPTVYNNNYQILQVPGYVVIHQEMIHDTRIIPLDGRPHVPASIGMWMGDPRGHWERQTLVVETTNFHPEAESTLSGASSNLMGPDAKVTERYTRTSATEMDYQFTVDAPTTFTRPFTASIPMRTQDAAARIMEYACVEGDRSVALTITGLIAQKKAKK